MKTTYNSFKTINKHLKFKTRFYTNKAKYYKIFNDSLVSNNYQFQKGINIANPNCEFTLCDNTHIFRDIYGGYNLVEINVEPSAIIREENNIKYTDKLILSEQQYELNKLDTIKMLVDEKAVELKGYTKRATLWSIEKGYNDIFQYLMTLPENQNINHILYFLAACTHRGIDCVNHLVSHGFDTNSDVCLNDFTDDVNKFRVNLYKEYVMTFKDLYQTMVPTFDQHIKTDICGLIAANYSNDIYLIDYLLSIDSVKMSPNYMDYITFSLFFANITGKTEIAEYFVSKGANVDLAKGMEEFANF